MPSLAVSPWPKLEVRKRKRALKREAVLHAAVQAFNEKGYCATSLDDVALSMNVTKPTIYYYFASKDEILFECVRLGLDGIREAAEAVADRGGSGMEKLRALMRDYVLMTKDFGICVTRTADHELTEASRAKFREFKREIDETICAVIEEGIRDGSVAAGDVRLMTFTIAGALNWIARWYEPTGPLTAIQIADGCVKALMMGLSPRGKDEA